MSRELEVLADGKTEIRRALYTDDLDERFVFGMKVRISEIAIKRRDQIEKATEDYFNLVKEILTPAEEKRKVRREWIFKRPYWLPWKRGN